jgi:membrane protein YdbS with pleckstrin-like domain
MKKQVNKKRKTLNEMIYATTIFFIAIILEIIIMIKLIDLEPHNIWPSSCIYLLVTCTTGLHVILFRYQYRAYKKYEKEEKEKKKSLRQANEVQERVR